MKYDHWPCKENSSQNQRVVSSRTTKNDHLFHINQNVPSNAFSFCILIYIIRQKSIFHHPNDHLNVYYWITHRPHFACKYMFAFWTFSSIALCTTNVPIVKCNLKTCGCLKIMGKRVLRITRLCEVFKENDKFIQVHQLSQKYDHNFHWCNFLLGLKISTSNWKICQKSRNYQFTHTHFHAAKEYISKICTSIFSWPLSIFIPV